MEGSESHDIAPRRVEDCDFCFRFANKLFYRGCKSWCGRDRKELEAAIEVKKAQKK